MTRKIIYTLPLHDALPILPRRRHAISRGALPGAGGCTRHPHPHTVGTDRGGPSGRPTRDTRLGLVDRRRLSHLDRKSTRLNSSHRCISYAVFCLKTKKIEM